MKTKCYCIFCPKHPLHHKQKEFKEVLTGWDVGGFISSPYEEQGAIVHCLSPQSDAFYDLNKEPEDFEWKITAYGDGCAITGYEGIGYCIRATCGNEGYKEI